MKKNLTDLTKKKQKRKRATKTVVLFGLGGLIAGFALGQAISALAAMEEIPLRRRLEEPPVGEEGS